MEEMKETYRNLSSQLELQTLREGGEDSEPQVDFREISLSIASIDLSNLSTYYESRLFHKVYEFCSTQLRRHRWVWSFNRAPLLQHGYLALIKGCGERAKRKESGSQEYGFMETQAALRLAGEYKAVLEFEYPDEEIGEETEHLTSKEPPLSSVSWLNDHTQLLQVPSLFPHITAHLRADPNDSQTLQAVVSLHWLSTKTGPILNTPLMKPFDSQKYIYPKGNYIYLKPDLIPEVDYRLLPLSEFVHMATAYGCPYAILRPACEVNWPLISLFLPDGSRKKVQISSQTTIDNVYKLLEKLHKGRALRLWVCSRLNITSESFRTLANAETLVYFPGKIAESTHTIAHYNLSNQENAFFIEFTQHGKYYFTDVLGEYRCSNCLETLSYSLILLKCQRCSQYFYCSSKCYEAGYVKHAGICCDRRCWTRLVRGRRQEREVMCGRLRNYGAVCYANAVLQGLASMSVVRKSMKKVRKNMWKEKYSDLVELFAELMGQLRSPSRSLHSAKPLVTSLSSTYDQFQPRQLHDSHEFLTCLLSSLHDLLTTSPAGSSSSFHSYAEFIQSQDSPIARGLYGILRSHITCPFGHVKDTYQEFSTLALPLTEYVATDTVKVLFFPLNKRPVLLEIMSHKQITVADLNEHLQDIEGKEVLIGHMRGKELAVLGPDTELKNYIAAKVEFLAYPRPEGCLHQYCEISFPADVPVKPRIVFIKPNMTLVDLHKAVFSLLKPYYPEKQKFSAPQSEKSIGYTLFYPHGQGKSDCEVCGLRVRETEACVLPYTEAEASGLVKVRPVARLQVRWHMGQRKVAVEKMDERECVVGRKLVHSVSLSSCINSMLAEEKLDSDNLWFCESCKQSVQANIRQFLAHAPKSLILHIKRFNVSMMTCRKLNDMVKFTTKFSLPLHSDSTDSSHKAYRLSSLIVHDGASLETGHFYAVCRVGRYWVKLDDSRMRVMAKKELLQLQAYLLFYEATEDY